MKQACTVKKITLIAQTKRNQAQKSKVSQTFAQLIKTTTDATLRDSLAEEAALVGWVHLRARRTAEGVGERLEVLDDPVAVGAIQVVRVATGACQVAQGEKKHLELTEAA